ncbi:hypothetical protein ACLKA7_007733 [Drosophila subpalustris]
MPKLKLWPGGKVELVADADMPKPQVYIGHFPKTEKYSNEDILQLLEGQNSALRTGDWRILNRVDRGKQIELTFAVDPNSDEKLKSVGHRLCYGFGQVTVRQRSKHSAEAKDAPTATVPVPAKTAQTPVLSQEVPSCSKSLTPTTRSGEEQSLEAASSTMAAPTANAYVATTERPAHHWLPDCARPYMVGSKVSTVKVQPWEEEGRSWPEQGPMAHSTLPSTHNNIRHLICLQANLHHAKAASDVLCCRFATEDLNVAFLQEQWILSGKIKGLNTKNGRLIYANEQQRPRAALLLNKKLTFVPLSQFITEDLVAVWAKVPTVCGEQEAVIASAYFPGESNDVHPERNSWNNPNLCIPSGAQVWYTDGSKLENGDTGTGVYGPRFRRSIAMGTTPSVLQAEIHAIEVDAECKGQLSSSYRIVKRL